jgi:cyanophycinase
MCSTLFRICTALILSAATGAAQAPAQTPANAPVNAPDAPRGTLFVVGGGTQPVELVRAFVDYAGGRGQARIVVFAMASEDGERSGEAKARDLRAFGAEAHALWISRAQADQDSIVQQVMRATGIWFGGGDQNRLMAVLRGTRVERAIQQRYQAGAVLGGTSAGAAVLSDQMITGNELGTATPSSEAWTRVARGTVAVERGLGVLPNAVIDQHFLRRKRFNRLLSLVLTDAPHLGVGIDEGTALIVEGDRPWRVAGASAVIIIDARRAARTDDANTALGAAGVQVHVLPAGGSFDPIRGEATLPAPVLAPSR